MNIRNESEKFELMFNNEHHIVPVGEFEVDDALGAFILKKGNNWGFKVTPVNNNSSPAIRQQITPVNTSVDNVVAEDSKETIEESESKKAGRPSKK